MDKKYTMKDGKILANGLEMTLCSIFSELNQYALLHNHISSTYDDYTELVNNHINTNPIVDDKSLDDIISNLNEYKINNPNKQKQIELKRRLLGL